jgi:hypothetical protein
MKKVSQFRMFRFAKVLSKYILYHFTPASGRYTWVQIGHLKQSPILIQFPRVDSLMYSRVG